MSGFRGTIGNGETDKVIGWVYDHIENMPPKRRSRIIKMIQKIFDDRQQVLSIDNDSFRDRVAKLIRRENEELIKRMINDAVVPDLQLQTRLLNICVKNYRKVVRDEYVTVNSGN